VTDLEELHNEKLVAHSRENDCPEICEDCDESLDTCGNNPAECEEIAKCEAAERQWEGMRDAYD